MDGLELTGYLAAIVIGLALGLVGGGGSILTVPVLVYLLGINPVLSTAYSLFVVGLTSLVGAATYMRRHEVSYKTALILAFPSFISVFLTRKFILPSIPQEIFQIGNLHMSKSHFIMLLFAILMALASLSMIRHHHVEPHKHHHPPSYSAIGVFGIGLGFLTGTVGAGGGFLIIPILVLLAKLQMKHAIGTSLLIIAINSLIGFTGDVMVQQIDWQFLSIFSAMAVAGILTGSYLAGSIEASKLRPAFGWF
ncbi:MAG: sulfite exporter TauE/SafE family protein, partial [Hymenobacteraceae bacterium]|nr:sulfite exporter TauE/SafE family protein [Hymenobacteraceae bacterium]MDX5397039.1 sulfite exporter TauE/SafE family protein [Hymenobacteraceae bacterium]MDX5513109.1 sulfite exporter TauE/SafE family protein [Hymenobacteraceae bacterium]